LVRGFYYPTPNPLKLQHRYTGDYSDASKARVTLVQIPFVRMREDMPGSIIRHNHSYTETVDKLNYFYDPRRRSLRVDSRNLTVTMEGEVIPSFTPAEYAFYAMFARNAVENPLEERGFQAPKNGDKSSGVDMVYSYLSELLPAEKRAKVDNLAIPQILDLIEEHLGRLTVIDDQGRPRSAQGLRGPIRDKILEENRLSNFADLKRRVTETIDSKLGERLGERYHPLQELDEEKRRRKKNSPFRLELDAACIEMVG
jgi:hypothetical protein